MLEVHCPVTQQPVLSLGASSEHHKHSRCWLTALCKLARIVLQSGSPTEPLQRAQSISRSCHLVDTTSLEVPQYMHWRCRASKEDTMQAHKTAGNCMKHFLSFWAHCCTAMVLALHSARDTKWNGLTISVTQQIRRSSEHVCKVL